MSVPSLSFQKSSQRETIIVFAGPWCIWTLDSYYKNFQETIESTAIQEINIIFDLSKVSKLDTAGALFLRGLRKNLERNKHVVTFQDASDEVYQIFELIEQYSLEPRPPQKKLSPFLTFIMNVGKATFRLKAFSLQLLSFLGEVVIVFARSLGRKVPFRTTAFFAHLQDVGLNALPIVGLISFLIGIVLAYQGVTQLRRFGAEIFTVNLLALGILREVGILITAIVIAGRSGSAFTAQIGTMVLNEEVDAMQTMGLNPLNVLVIPRIMALIIALPLLTFFSDVIGLLGGAFMTHILMDLSYAQFIEQLKSAATPTAFWVGMSKAPLFAFLIALIGCFEGFTVQRNAESIGRHTTKSVVESIFFVIVSDAGFSILFSYLGV